MNNENVRRWILQVKKVNLGNAEDGGSYIVLGEGGVVIRSTDSDMELEWILCDFYSLVWTVTWNELEKILWAWGHLCLPLLAGIHMLPYTGQMWKHKVWTNRNDGCIDIFTACRGVFCWLVRCRKVDGYMHIQSHSKPFKALFRAQADPNSTLFDRDLIILTEWNINEQNESINNSKVLV